MSDIVWKTHLSNLLARIQRDGGHREQEVGTAKAVEEADAVAAQLIVDAEANLNLARERDERYDCRGGPGTTTPACGGCVTCLHRVIEAVTRERDEARAELNTQAAAHARFRRRNRALWLRAVDAKREQMQNVVKQRDEARTLAAAREAEVARLREALTQVRDAMLATGQGPDGDDDPRRPLATAVWSALASTPAPGPTEREMRVAKAAVEACRAKILGTAALPEYSRGIKHCLHLLGHLDYHVIAAKAVGREPALVPLVEQESRLEAVHDEYRKATEVIHELRQQLALLTAKPTAQATHLQRLPQPGEYNARVKVSIEGAVFNIEVLEFKP